MYDVSRTGDFRSYWLWEPVLAEVGGRKQQLVYITVERASGEHVLAAYGLCRYTISASCCSVPHL